MKCPAAFSLPTSNECVGVRAGYGGGGGATTYASASERYAAAPAGPEERRSVAGLHIPGASTM
jgi:hypothetical protein